MKILSIDIETYSNMPISSGVYKYVEGDFRVLLFAYKEDNGPTKIIDCTTQKLPHRIIEALTDPTITKTAFNAQFERVCLNRWLAIQSGPWDCTMIRAWRCGLEGGLAAVSKELGIPEDQQKMKIGKSLIKKFSTPQRETKKRPSTRPYTKDELPEEWETFKDYCIRDVDVEHYIREKLLPYPVPAFEYALYTLDQRINDRGVRIDREMAENAIQIDEEQTAYYTNLFHWATGIDSPNRIGLLKTWLSGRGFGVVNAIRKDNMPNLREQFKADPKALTALDCREKTGKTSVTKYAKMLETAGEGDRVRGTLQFYGAQNTGRWAGRLIQVQNLPQNHINDLDTARQVIKYGDFELLSILYDSPADVISQCIRPTLIPSEGSIFAVADYNAIEARVVAWLSGEERVLDIFRNHGKIYEATASAMFHIPMEEIKKGSMERQKGKVATLACGYGGGVGAFERMGGARLGMSEADMKDVVDRWREANPRIVQFWHEAEDSVKQVLTTKGSTKIMNRLPVSYDPGFLWITLPSGRRLAYPKPRLVHSETPFSHEEIQYGNPDGTGAWQMTSVWGGTLVENITQATARDCLAYAMARLEEEGFPIIFHVHDEVIIEIPKDRPELLNRITEIMGEPIPWAEGLPLRADGYTCNYYKKD